MIWQFFAAGSWTPAGLVLTWLIQSTVLLAAGLLAGRILRKQGPAVQSALYRTTLGAVILCPFASVSMAAMGFGGLLIRLPISSENVGNGVVRGPLQQPTPPTTAVILAAEPTGQTPVPSLEPKTAIEPTMETTHERAIVADVPSPRRPDPLPQWSGIIGWVGGVLLTGWLLGAAVLSLRVAVGHRRMGRLRSAAIDAEPDALALCGGLARRMNLTPPSVLRSPFLSSPCLDGLRRPAILLPEDAEEHLRETFIHELAHLQRRDGFWNLLRHVATAVFWVQPLLWLLSKRLEATAEEVCDDYVVGYGADRCRYAGHLLELAERRLTPLAPTGVGMVSLRSLLARRIARILDSTRRLSTQAGRRATAATLLAGLVGTLLVGLIGVGGANIEVLGDELKAEKPQMTLNPSPSTPRKTVSEPKGVPITGRIVDLEGRPVAGATVRIRQITKPKGDNLDLWIEAVKRGEPPWITYEHVTYEPPIAPEEKQPKTLTDAEGRFRFEGLEPERIVALVIQGPTISYTSVDVVTRRTEPIPAKGFPSNYGSEARRVHGIDFTYTVVPGRPVEGVVRDARTNEPLAGVQLVSDHFAGAIMWGISDLKTTTDGQGRFRLVGLPKGSGNVLMAIPNDDQPYFLHKVPVPDPPGMAPVQLEVALHQGIWIEGKVTEKETGQPVSGAWLYYLPFLENPFAQATPEFDRHGNGPGATQQDRYQTKPDGSYRLVGLAGRAIVGVDSHSNKSYLMGEGAAAIKGMTKNGHFETWRNPVNPGKFWPTSMKEITPTEATKVVHLDFQLDSGAKVRVRVVDPQGKSVSGLKLAGRTQRGRHEYDVKRETEFDVVTLAPDEDRMLLIRQEEKKLGKVVHVKPGDDKAGPVTVKLEPMASIAGRVEDADGNPVCGATIRTDPQPGGDFSLSLGQIASDKDGRFVVPNVPIGCSYSLVAEGQLTAKDRRVAFSENVAVRPGESTDVNEIRFKND